MRLIAVLVLVVCSSDSAQAALINTSPAVVCAFLTDQGLPTSAWAHQYDDLYGCNSSYKELGSGYPLANNLAYYVDGKAASVTQVKLVLNVNSSSQAKSAHAALLKGAKALSLKATGTALPPSVAESITSGTSNKKSFGNSWVQVKREDWPTGRGYEIHVIFG
jgi:hypothetical protein